MNFYVTKHPIKQRNIFIQLLELFLLPVDIIICFAKGYNTGKLQYGFGNSTIEMRRKYCATAVYPWSIRNYLLHRIGVTLMDPFGNHMKQYYAKNGFMYRHPLDIYEGETQYIHSFNPVVRKIIKEYIIHALENNCQMKVY